ncbi:MAG: lipase family alpha/beta hydrolase [Chthoniobacterales bacterium]
MKSLRTRNRLLAASLLIAQPLPAATPRHVVLIHGIWDTFHTMRKMETRLRDAGFEPLVITLTPNGGERPLDDLGQQVNRQIKKSIPAGERFSIVGFSMGGMVARSYLRQFGDPERIETFVSIASPHRGTWTAWLEGSPGVRDMRPGSAFLAGVNADAARFSSVNWITIRTPLDLMILPSNSSTLSWAENHSVPVLMHPLLVWDGRVLDAVVCAMRYGTLNTRSAREQQASPRAESPRSRTANIPQHR